MKRNLIILLFTLLLGGITCCNYSYASTVNVSESFCKNIIDIQKQKAKDNFKNNSNQNDYYRRYDDTMLSTEMNKEWFDWDEYTDKKIQNYNDYIEYYGNEAANNIDIKTTCESNGCLYFHEKCVACPWIRLNTDIPFIGNCIPTDSQSEIFPVFIGWLIKFATSLLLLVGFIVIIISGVMIASGDDESVKKGKEWIRTVVKAMALLWASGVILKMINPNFFN